MTKLPWRTIILFISVSVAVIAPFILWGGKIDMLVQNAVERARENTHLVAAILFLVLASDIFLPVPSTLVGALCGLFLGLPLGWAVSFLAMTASAAAGYAIGKASSKAAIRFIGEEEANRLEELGRKCGPLLVLAMRPVPVLSEASMVFAGIGRMPLFSVAWQALLGNAAVSLVYVYMGVYFADRENSSLPAFAATFLLAAAFMLASKFLPDRKA